MVQSCTKSSCFAISSLNRSLNSVRFNSLIASFEDLLVHFETDLGHKAALLATQHITRAANIQVAHGNLETAAQVAMLFQRLQPFSRIGGQGSQRRRQQITECFFIAPSHPSAQLVQIAQSKLVGIVDNDRIHIGNIHTALHDIGTNQHIIFLIDKIQDPFFQFMTFHLPMCITDAQIGTKSLDDGRHFRQTLYPVIDKEDLAASFRFIINGIADKIFIVYHALPFVSAGGWAAVY